MNKDIKYVIDVGRALTTKKGVKGAGYPVTSNICSNFETLKRKKWIIPEDEYKKKIKGKEETANIIDVPEEIKKEVEQTKVNEYKKKAKKTVKRKPKKAPVKQAEPKETEKKPDQLPDQKALLR